MKKNTTFIGICEVCDHKGEVESWDYNHPDGDKINLCVNHEECKERQYGCFHCGAINCNGECCEDL